MELTDKEKDKLKTKQKLLNALEEIVIDEGFEKLGINVIAAKAGVSKVLIYRYFGSIDDMVLEFLSQKKIWDSFSIDFPNAEDFKIYVKRIFRNQIAQLRSDSIHQRLYRWELSTKNETVDKMRLKRESVGVTLVTIISQLSQHSQEEVAALATIMSTSISYLVLLSENCPIYNGIDLQTDKGWEQITFGLDLIIDKCFDMR